MGGIRELEVTPGGGLMGGQNTPEGNHSKASNSSCSRESLSQSPLGELLGSEARIQRETRSEEALGAWKGMLGVMFPCKENWSVI